MSKIDWNKELKDSLIDASLLTAGVFGLSWVGSKVGIAKPNLSMTAENIGKFAIYLTVSDVLKDYAKRQKWIPS